MTGEIASPENVPPANVMSGWWNLFNRVLARRQIQLRNELCLRRVDLSIRYGDARPLAREVDARATARSAA